MDTMKTGATVRLGRTRRRFRMTAVEPCTIVIFGISGDLAHRKLIPALYHLHAVAALPERFQVVGVSRRASDRAALCDQLRASAAKQRDLDGPVWDDLASRIDCVAGSATEPETFTALTAKLEAIEADAGMPGNRLFYFAVSPGLFAPILAGLRDAGLIRDPESPPWSRVILEKPFGRDLPTAHALNAAVGGALDERQTYRIDHYLGKETVQNLIVLRFANVIFEPLWSRAAIEQVQITAAETLLVSGRGQFYDETGVVRDIIQNHLLQILALVAMEPPVSLSADDVRDQKVQVLRALRPVDADRDVVFGQYAGYHEVDGVSAGSRTPTYAAIRAHIDNWRWHGVPFYLRAGKGLAAKSTEVVIDFRELPGVLFGRGDLASNQLVIKIQPDEGISLRFNSKVPGEGMTLNDVDMTMSYADAFHCRAGDAYERLLLDAIRGDATLFARRDEVEEAWRWVDPFIARGELGAQPIPSYATGSQGPADADDLLASAGHRWETIR